VKIKDLPKDMDLLSVLIKIPPEVSTSDILEWRLASPSEQRN
jgi:hypothetical protein